MWDIALLGYRYFLKGDLNASNIASFSPMSYVCIHGGRCVKYNRKTADVY